MDNMGEVGNNGLVVRRYSIANERGSGLRCSWMYGRSGKYGRSGEVLESTGKILGGGSCVRWISCELGVRGVVAGKRKEEEEENICFRHFGIYGEKLVGGLYTK